MPSRNSYGEYIASALTTFAYNKHLIDGSLVQMTDEQLHTPLASETNSVAVILKHLSGNLLSRFSDFLLSDGEKPWRDRDDEFIDTFRSREEMIEYWDSAWNCLTVALGQLTDDDLLRIVTIRGEPHTVHQAVTRSLAHFAYHAGQIVMISRILVGDAWQVLTIPRDGSRQYNEQTWGSPQFRPFTPE
jgi:uncharacterized damage-inducible protein DinB